MLRKRFLTMVLSMIILGSSALPVFAQEQHEHDVNCDHDMFVLVDDTYYTVDEYLEILNAEVDSQDELESELPTIQPFLFGCTNVLGHKWEWTSWRSNGSVTHAAPCVRGFIGEYAYFGCLQPIGRTASCSRTYCDKTNSETDNLVVWCKKW